jgi:DNA-binding MarR family transcriptional regulator
MRVQRAVGARQSAWPGRRSSTAFSAELAPLGIEGRHFGVLLQLSQLSRRGPLSQRQLTEFTGRDKSTMVRNIDDLEDRGLVIRRPAVGDRRPYAVDLTDAGRELFARAEERSRSASAMSYWLTSTRPNATNCAACCASSPQPPSDT